MKDKLIEKYLFNTLNDEETKLFLELKNNDAEFREALEYQENLKQVCKIEDDLQFKKMIASFEEAIKKENNRNPLNHSFYYKMAVAAVLVISLGFFITTFFFKKEEPKALFATYFEVSKNVSYPIIRSSPEENQLTTAFIAYENKDFTQALTLFEAYFEETKDTTILYYQANVLLASDKPEQAIALLNIVEHSSSNLSSRTHWYKALAYLKSNKQAEAILELEIAVKNQEEFKKVEAQNLLKQLN